MRSRKTQAPQRLKALPDLGTKSGQTRLGASSRHAAKARPARSNGSPADAHSRKLSATHAAPAVSTGYPHLLFTNMNANRTPPDGNPCAPSDEEIAECAYYIWESEGHPIGKEEEHWNQAKMQLYLSRALDDALESDKETN